MKKLALLLAVIIFSVIKLYASEDAPNEIIKVAETWASEHYHGTIGKGTPFYNSQNAISAWCFKVYRGTGKSPSSTEILTRIGELRKERIQAELDLYQYFAIGDKSKISETSTLIADLWADMRNADSFATIFVTIQPYPHVAFAYPGLPPYYVFLQDAVAKANTDLLVAEVKLDRLYFFDPLNIYAKFKSNEKSTFINIILPNKKPFSGLLAPPINSNPINAKISQAKNSLNKSLTTIEEIITGVPEYNSSPNPSGFGDDTTGYCRQVAAAMVLGYWDDKGFTDLIDGGGSNYAGQRYVNGWLNLVEELSEGGMGYGGGQMSVVDDAVEKVCNHTDYSNNYDFQSTYDYYYDTNGVPTDWNYYTSEIDAGRPFVYKFDGWFTLPHASGGDTTLYANHAVAAIGYKKTGELSTQKWRIVNYNSIIIEAPCYMCEDDMNVGLYTSINKVIPGGGYTLSMSGPTSLDEYENGTFTANASGAVSPFSYTWYRMEGFDLPDKDEKPDNSKRPPVGVWVYHSSGSSSAVSNGVSPGFKMKCVVEDDVGYEKEVIKTIYISDDKSKKIISDSNQGTTLPTKYHLSPNFPNPFNPETTINYSLPTTSSVNLSIYDIHGRVIRLLIDEEQSAGFYKCTWNGKDNDGIQVTSGLYIGLIKAGKYTEKIKMMLVR